MIHYFLLVIMQTDLIIINGQCPSKSNQYRIAVIGGKKSKARATMYKSKEMKEWEASFQEQLIQYENPRILGEFQLGINVFFDSRKSDLDNSFKGVLDCLQKAHWITNDNQCMKITAKKFVSANARIEFQLRY